MRRSAAKSFSATNTSSGIERIITTIRSTPPPRLAATDTRVTRRVQQRNETIGPRPVASSVIGNLEYARKHDLRIDEFIEATASGRASETRHRLDATRMSLTAKERAESGNAKGVIGTRQRNGDPAQGLIATA